MAKPMFLVPIVFFIIVLDPVQFIGWVVPSCVYTDAVLGGIIDNL